MNDLDTLRPEVRDALFSVGKRCDAQTFDTLSTELLRLARNDADARIALDADHDWKEMYERAKKAEAELAALKAKIADAPAVVVQGAPGAVKASFNGYGCFEYAAENLQPKLRGKRVRLLVEE